MLFLRELRKLVEAEHEVTAQVADMVAAGFRPGEIRERLGITNDVYSMAIHRIRMLHCGFERERPVASKPAPPPVEPPTPRPTPPVRVTHVEPEPARVTCVQPEPEPQPTTPAPEPKRRRRPPEPPLGITITPL